MFAALGIILSVLLVVAALKKAGASLIFMPIACVFFLCLALWRDDEYLVFQALIFAPVFIVATSSAVLLSRAERDSQRWPRYVAGWILIVLLACLLLAVAVALLSEIPALGIFLLIAFLCVVGFFAATFSFQLTARRTNAAYVLSTINSSMKQNLPLPMALDAAASGSRDARSVALQRIHKWLVQGYSLSDSIRRGYPKCPSRIIAMIDAAERIGQLPKAIMSLGKDLEAKSEQDRRIEPVGAFYPIVLFCIMSAIVWFLMVFVMPMLSEVITEMSNEARMPAQTRFLMGVFRYVVYDQGVFFTTLLLLIVLVVIPLSIRTRFRPRRPVKPYLLSRIGDWLKWRLPISHWFAQNYSLVQTIEMLKLSLGADRTVNDAISSTLDLDLNGCFKKRLKKWLGKVERGDNISEAARCAGLGAPLAWAFDEKVNQGNTLTILEALESFYRSNYSYRVNLARFILWPSTTLAMALMIGFVVYAIYSAPIEMIHRTAEMVYP